MGSTTNEEDTFHTKPFGVEWVDSYKVGMSNGHIMLLGINHEQKRMWLFDPAEIGVNAAQHELFQIMNWMRGDHRII